ncbi:MAG: hypothetical protein ACI9LM_000109 [Alteromonadaceae bacterium]|jgi:hypothetical protein
MPLLLIPWLAGGALGFGAGFMTSDGIGKLLKLGVFSSIAAALVYFFLLKG